MVPDTTNHASYAAAEIVSENNKVKGSVEFILTQGETWLDGKDYRSTKTNGDLKAIVKFKRGQARNLRVLRYAQGSWDLILKSPFDASGCAGDTTKAIACVTSLSNGGPAATNATDTKPDQLVQIGLDLSQFSSVLSPNPIVGNAMTVRTSRDIALGNL